MNFFYDMLSLRGNVSSTRFVYFMINIVSVLVILACVFVMVVETFKPEKTNFDYFSGLAKIIGACAGLVAFAGATKVFTDKFDVQSEMSSNNNPECPDYEEPAQNPESENSNISNQETVIKELVEEKLKEVLGNLFKKD